jgi:hypothetical protein
LLLRMPGFPKGFNTDSSGFRREFTDAQLAACAAAYSPTLHEAPLVVGHPSPENELPHGWVERLEYENNRLTAYAGRLSGEMFRMLENNQARKYSFAFYPENNPSNPTPGVLYLRHIGIVSVPAIKDNPEPEMVFSDSFLVQFTEEVFMNVETKQATPVTATVSAEFVEKQATPVTATVSAEFVEKQATLQAQEAALKQREAALAEKERIAKEREISAFTEALVSEGKILPRQKDGVIKFLASIDTPATLTFSEPEGERNIDSVAWLKDFLTALPKQVEFAELAKPDGTKKETPEDETAKQVKARLAEKGVK